MSKTIEIDDFDSLPSAEQKRIGDRIEAEMYRDGVLDDDWPDEFDRRVSRFMEDRARRYDQGAEDEVRP